MGMIDLHLGDCLDILRQMPDNSIDALVTDPPAGIGFMGVGWDTFDGRKTGNSRPRNRNGSGEWDWIGSKERPRTADQQKRVIQKQRDAFVAWFTPIMSECLRVLKPGAHALVWALPRTSHWTGWALEEAGFEVRDRIAHLFGSGFPKSLDVSKAIDKMAGAEREVIGPKMRPDGKAMIDARPNGFDGSHEGWDRPWKHDRAAIELQASITAPATPAAVQWQGWGTALKPACEDWWLCRKPLAEGTVAANVLEWGTGAINVDGCRVATNEVKLDAPYLYHGNNGNSMGAASERLRTNGGGTTNTQGRFPANVTHDGSEEVIAGFPMSKDGVAVGGYKTASSIYGTFMGRKDDAPDIGYGGEGSAARFFYCAKASRQDREEGCEGLEEGTKRILNSGIPSAVNSDPRGMSGGGDRTARNHHPTVKPTPLMRWLCRLIAPPGGTVLDPFMGSGSTGKAAALEGFGFIGIELDPEYFEIAKRRIEQAMMQPRLEGI